MFEAGLTSERTFGILSNNRSQNKRSCPLLLTIPNRLERHCTMSTTFAPVPSRFHVHVPARASSSACTHATYRRRRIGAAAFGVALVMSVGSMAQHGLADRGGEPASVSAVGQGYVVAAGDTLWRIAERLYPNTDTSTVVDALVSLNSGASIQIGQVLYLP